MDRTIVNSVLAKLGVEQPERFDDARALAKLKTRLEKNAGKPLTLSSDEQKLVDGLGVVVKPAASEATKSDAKTAAPKAETPKGAKPAAKSAKSGAKKASSDKPASDAKKTTPAKTTSKDKATPAKSDAKKTDKPKRVSMSDTLRAMFPDKTTHVKREKIMAALAKLGVKESTAHSYLTWALNPRPRKETDRFQFYLEETEKGIRFVKDHK